MNDNVQYPLPADYRYTTLNVASGEEGIELLDINLDRLRVFPNFVLAISQLATHVENGCSINWEVDRGEEVEFMRATTWAITESFGSLEHPINLQPPIIIISRSRFFCTNADPLEEHRFSVFLYGELVTRETFKNLCRDQC